MRIKYLVPIVLLAISCQEQPNRDQLTHAQIDSLKKLIRTGTSSFYQHGDFKGADQYLRSIADSPQVTAHPSLKAYWWTTRARCAIVGQSYDSAAEFLEKAEHFAKIGDTLYGAQIHALTEKASLQFDLGNYDKAIQFALEAKNMTDKHLSSGKVRPYLLLVNIFLRSGDTANLIKYIQEGLPHATIPEEKYLFIDHLASYHGIKGNLDSAKYYTKLYLEDTTLSANPESKASRLESIGVMMLRNKQLDGIIFLHQAIALYRQVGRINEGIYINLSQSHIDLRNQDSARIYLDSAVTIAKHNSNWGLIAAGYREQSKAYMRDGLLHRAMWARDSADFYHQKLDSTEMAKTMLGIEARYAAKSKDERIKHLAETAAVNQQISNLRLYTIIAICLIFVLLTVLIITFFRRRGLELQIREHELHQQLLRSQMEDHFLYNSLSNLQHLIRAEDPEGALFYLGKFSRLLQMNQFNSHSNYVPLVDEVAALEAYLALQKIHLNHRFKYIIHIYEGMEQDQMLIPPMLLQPFVENAVVHGMQDPDHFGTIEVSIKKKEGYITCTITDDGPGKVHKQSVYEKPSLSTKITNERLEILGRRTGRPGKLIMEKRDTISGGMMVIIDIPYHTGMDLKYYNACSSS